MSKRYSICRPQKIISMKDPRNFYFQMKVCFEKGITIYPKPAGQNKAYRIVINRSGREKVGHEIYKDKAYDKISVDKSSGHIKKIMQHIPSVWDKILIIYDDIYQKNFKGMLPAEQAPFDYENHV